jgi:hypothetical protein
MIAMQRPAGRWRAHTRPEGADERVRRLGNVVPEKADVTFSSTFSTTPNHSRHSEKTF